MRQAPSWLVERIVDSCPEGPRLWVGPDLAFPAELAIEVQAPGQSPRSSGFKGVLVAAVEGELVPVLRSLRAACVGGGRLALLLPQPGDGVRGALGAMFGVLGREGRKPRALTEQCAALLAAGLVDIDVCGRDPGRACVVGRLPEAVLPLDSAFEPNN